MEKIKKVDPDFNLTEEDIIEAKKEDPNFELTEDDLRLGLWVREFSPYWEGLMKTFERMDERERRGGLLEDDDPNCGNILMTPVEE